MKPAIFVMFLMFSACGKPQEAMVTRASDGQHVPMKFVSLTGSRDGYLARGRMEFSDINTGGPLLIDFVLEPGVPTRFQGGEFQWRTEGGPVSCTSIDFFGGQGGYPSIGGSFAFQTKDGTQYKVYLPVTEMTLDRN